MEYASFKLRCWIVGVALTALLMMACERPPQDRTSASSGVSRPDAARDLSQDEAEGGHTLHRHVGRTDAELKQRLEQEPNISAASTYTDRATAETAVGTALEQNRSKIGRWLHRSGAH